MHDRKNKSERPIITCKEAVIKLIEENDDVFDLAHKTEGADATCNNLEQWLKVCN